MPEPVLVWLASDQADVALRQADETIRRWPAHMTLTQHYHHVIATGQVLLYAGRPWEAWRRIVTAWPELRRARYLSLACPRHLLLFLRASIAVAAAASAPLDASAPGWTAAQLLRVARRDARRLARGDLPFAAPCAHTIRAALAARKGNAHEASRLLQSAVAGFDRAGMPVHRESARLRLGAVLGNGTEHGGAARAWMTAAGIRRPDALAAVFAGGPPDATT
jgi:eukaryotic-like serine/threonine-protein kinase